ncbi:hypothetical protein [Deinococcus puniceus]|uniref:Uncharacterized protein n=1 Tax=Deinococcus puniceus TaxID=1182568 RepID=A0A172T9F8_9DEIO|nr:hypothetical protein [Deinococcus puniceus]ANE43640.1 hypothetical protein SU48_07500 [Deinococcus puniceus]
MSASATAPSHVNREPIAASALLDLLAVRGGQEFRVAACVVHGRGRRQEVREVGEYRFTVRGDAVQATGPSGQTRQLSRAGYLDIFGGYTFRGAEATGEMTDLGPLFS